MPPPSVRLSYDEPAGERSMLKVRIAVVPGWHVNANIAADEFLVPSRLEVGGKGMTFGPPAWPEAHKEYSEALQLENLVFKDTFEVLVPVVAMDADADPATTNVIFHYQACSNFICLAPSKVSAGMAGFSLEPPVPESITPLKKKDLPFLELIRLLLLSFLGGLILNLMPCVLPVLSLKVFSLVRQSRDSRSSLLRNGLATTAGILLSFWVLALAILVVRSAGGLTGWGFQFQHTGFIVLMSILLTLFAANLFGAFEIWLPGKALTRMDHFAHKEGVRGAFLQGALLTLLSTPCSAPFLGTAMGFALGASAPMLFYFFGAAALGLSAPYLLISAFPGLVRWLPRPGAWMIRFRQLLAFPMLGTVIWLIWVLGQQTSSSAMAAVLVLLCITTLFAWLSGWLAPPGKPFHRVPLVWGAALLLLVPFWLYSVLPAIEKGKVERVQMGMMQSADGWMQYTPELLQELRREQKTVFLDFTADWCITCKANEKAVLARDTIRAVLRDLDVVLVKADWTTQNPDISRLLAQFGRSGVPFYLVYPAGDHDNPIILPELLTIDTVLNALERAGPSLR